MIRWFKRYIRKKSRLSLFSDAVFIVIIVLLLIPMTRTAMISQVSRLVSFQPSVSRSNPVTLTENDYRWSYYDEEGQSHSFSEKKGEVVLLNHWATWCPHCVAELPSLEALYKDYGDKVTFIFLSYEDPAVMRAFLDKRGLTIPFHVSTGGIPGMLNARSIPRTFIIGRDGRIYVDKTGAAKWNGSRVHELLDELLLEGKPARDAS